MKIGIVTFPGSDTQELVYVLKNILRLPVEEIWHQNKELDDYGPEDCVVLPAGSSYGDYVRAGALAKTSNILKAIQNHARKGGYILGIDNGFQILCEARLLPGIFLPNSNLKHISKLVHMRVETSDSPLTESLTTGDILILPVSHSSGRYYCDENSLAELKQNDSILFKYSDSAGQVNDRTNINGSTESIAGICDKNRKVVGLMALPERASESIVGLTDGKLLFENFFKSAIKVA